MAGAEPKALFFIPYPSWLIHSQVDLLLALLLRHKGYHIILSYCDHYYPTCPVLESCTTTDQKKKRCTSCQHASMQLFSEQNLPKDVSIIPLSDLLKSYAELPIKARQMSDLDRSSMESTFTALRTGFYGLHLNSIAEYNQICHSDLRSLMPALYSLLACQLPSLSICFNGRFGLANLFASLASGLRIPTLIHEKGNIAGSYMMYVQTTKPTLPVYNSLFRAQVIRDSANNVIHDPPSPKSLTFGSKHTSVAPYNSSRVREESDIAWITNNKGKLLVSYFPSTFDENLTDCPSLVEQAALMRRIKQLADNNPDACFAIRLHPDFFKRKGIVNHDIIINSLVARLRESPTACNFRIIKADGITSLRLAAFSDLCIIPTSSLAMDIRLAKISTKIISYNESRYQDCADTSTAPASKSTMAAIRHFLSACTTARVTRNESTAKKFYNAALRLWSTDVNLSVQFKSIGCDNTNPAIPDFNRLNRLIANFKSEHHYSEILEDLPLCEQIIAKSQWHLGSQLIASFEAAD
jgi:hypothetical protein